MNTSALEASAGFFSASSNLKSPRYLWQGAVVWLTLLSVLSACGGADEAATSSPERGVAAAPDKTIAAAHESSNRTSKRQLRSGEMTGVTALAMSRDRTSVGVANADGFYDYTPEEARLWQETFERFSFEIRELALRYPADVVKRALEKE